MTALVVWRGEIVVALVAVAGVFFTVGCRLGYRLGRSRA